MLLLKTANRLSAPLARLAKMPTLHHDTNTIRQWLGIMLPRRSSEPVLRDSTGYGDVHPYPQQDTGAKAQQAPVDALPTPENLHSVGEEAHDSRGTQTITTSAEQRDSPITL